MQFFSYRQWNLLGLFLVLIILGAAAYIQFGLGLQPCSLCILQRLCFILLGIFFFIHVIYKPARYMRIMQSVFIILFSLLGALLAGRQVWLQHLPPGQAPGCMPSLSYLLHNAPVSQILAIVFKGSTDCAEPQQAFFYLSMPEWSLIFFIIFIGLGIVQLANGSTRK
jgi:disulfide bond formation protein DsbB